MDDGNPNDASVVAAYLLERTRRRVGRRWDQGAQAAGWDVPRNATPELQVFAMRRVFGVPLDVSRGMLAWAAGARPGLIRRDVPHALDVLGAQADGKRWVSLLEDADAHAHGDPRHPDGLSFALHDLCHLEKFVDAAHHRGQVGFFRACCALISHPVWLDVEAGLDLRWQADRDYVFADMNGSAVFLFAALKMKLKMATRRLVSHRNDSPPTAAAGPLLPREQARYLQLERALLAAMGLPESLQRDGSNVSARRDAPDAAARLLAYFEARGG